MEILRHSKSKLGYTLLELIVVLALFAIILSIAIPSIGVIFNIREKDELKTFRRDIMHIRTSAIVENCIYKLTLDVKNNSYILSKENSSTGKMENIKTVEFKHGIQLKKSQLHVSILFKSTGAPNTGSTIYLRNSKKQDIEISITPATGSVNLKIKK